MRHAIRIMLWAILMATLAVPSVWSQEAAIAAASADGPMAPRLEWFEDPKGLLTIHEVASAALRHRFQPHEGSVLALLPSRSYFWLKIHPAPTEGGRPAGPTAWWLELANPNLDEADLFLEGGLPGTYQVKTAGALRGSWEQDLRYRTILFQIPSGYSPERPIFLRIRNHALLNVPIRLWRPEAFERFAFLDLFFFGLLFGVLASMILANFFIFLTLWDRTYLWYVLYMASMLVYLACLFGPFRMAADFGPGRVLMILWVALGMAFWFAFLFCREFLDTQNNAPGLGRLLAVVMAFGPVILVLGLLGYNSLANIVAHVPGVAGPVIAVVAAVAAYRRGFRPARFFLAAWLMLLLGALFFALEGLKVFPHSLITTYMLPFGAALESVLLSFALADRIRRLRHERQLAEEASRAKSRFLAGMSHEIRTPLNAVIGLTDITLATNLDKEQRQHLETVRDAGRHLLAIVNDVLDFSKIEADRLELDRIDFDLRGLLAATLNVMGHQAAQKGLVLRHQVDETIPALVRGDPNRLRQVVVNLVGNAIKFTKTGGVTVEVWARDENAGAEPSDDRVGLLFSVADTGIGIPPETRDRIFQSFEQADGSITREYGGTGLGLSIARRLVTLMNGRIWFESEAGQGTTFYFVVRLDRASDTLVRPESEEPAVPETSLPCLRLLVVEDNDVNAQVARMLLERRGHKVQVAVDGREAIQALSAQSFDMVLMDLEMPRMDGLEATRAIRRGEAGAGARDIPIIAMTAHAVLDVRDECLAAGMNDFVTKPVSVSELGAALARIQVPDREPVEAPAPTGTESGSPRVPPFPGGGEPPTRTDMPPSSAGDEPQLAAVPPSSGAGLAESGPVFDPSLALELLGLDADLFGQVLEASLRELEERLDAARLALDEADFVLAARAAHTMKSTAAGIGAMAVRDRAVALERSARKDDIEEARVALQKLVRAHQAMKAAVNRTHGAAGPSGREPTDKENAD